MINITKLINSSKFTQMRHFYICLVLTALLANLTSNAFAKQRPISKDELHDKINAFWLGQLVGNYIGLPFENNYVDEAIPELIDRIYSVEDDTKLEINEDWKGNIPLLFNYFEGAFADDDTDIEFVTLHAVEKYGLRIYGYEDGFRDSLEQGVSWMNRPLKQWLNDKSLSVKSLTHYLNFSW